MRKLIYVSADGKETGSWDTAKTWGNYSIRLDEIHEKVTKEEQERRERRWAKLAEIRKNRNA